MINLMGPMQHQLVSGRRLLIALGGGVGSAAVLGCATFYPLRPLFVETNRALSARLIVLEVYTILIAAFRMAFGPLKEYPVACRSQVWLGTLWRVLALYHHVLVAPNHLQSVHSKQLFGRVAIRDHHNAPQQRLENASAIGWLAIGGTT